MIPEAREVHLSRKDRKVLEACCRSPVTLQRDLKRARIVLLAADGRSTRYLRNGFETDFTERNQISRIGVSNQPHLGEVDQPALVSNRKVRLAGQSPWDDRWTN